MLFNSGSFLAAFAVFAVVYYAAAHRIRWVLLLAASFAFYATFTLAYLPLLVALTIVAYGGGLLIERAGEGRRLVLLAAIGVAVAVLGVEKYLHAPGSPAGLSFYTFSCISYLADVYSRRIAAERHAGYLAVYVSFFPKLLAGPIERAQPFLSRLRQPVRFSSAGVTSGLQLFLWGLFKKVVIADRLASIVAAAYGRPAFASPADLLIATYFFAFQIYCDFSGYSDMAIGASRILGLDLMENFRRPYLATTTAEFWARRWHLSLTTWFRDYVYIPLGGSRVARPRWAFNLLIVFVLSGLWHGAAWTFVVWGALNGIYVLVSNIRTRRAPLTGGSVRTVVRAVVTFHLILVTWVFFRAASLDDALTIFSRIAASAGRLPSLVAVRLTAPDVAAALLLVVLLVAIELLDETRSMWERLAARPTPVRWAAYYALALALVVFGVWNLQQFVYMQF
ncbi:MAG TPA: MBOAT family O-acyltransferase [Vicinamibacterales bacterium]|jgi:D-alanyl-lipoteichoic acid acyltransferase DltB (MBOAT superfamily)